MSLYELIEQAVAAGHDVEIEQNGMIVKIRPKEKTRASEERQVRKEEPDPQKEEKKPPIDHGKIIALHKAGWNMSKIAEEMGCSIQTVSNHIKKEMGE